MSPLLRFSARLPLLLCALGLIHLTAHATPPVYQWKDTQGVTHYSDKPPANQNYQDRRINARGVTPAQPSASPPAENAQCLNARKNLQLLQSTDPVAQTGEDGKPGKALDADQRANQLALAKAAEKAYCTPTRP